MEEKEWGIAKVVCEEKRGDAPRPSFCIGHSRELHSRFRGLIRTASVLFTHKLRFRECGSQGVPLVESTCKHSILRGEHQLDVHVRDTIDRVRKSYSVANRQVQLLAIVSPDDEPIAA